MGIELEKKKNLVGFRFPKPLTIDEIFAMFKRIAASSNFSFSLTKEVSVDYLITASEEKPAPDSRLGDYIKMPEALVLAWTSDPKFSGKAREKCYDSEVPFYFQEAVLPHGYYSGIIFDLKQELGYPYVPNSEVVAAMQEKAQDYFTEQERQKQG